MIKGVRYIYYKVADMKKAIRFYTEALQMELGSVDNYWTALNCGGVHVGLHPTHGDEEVFQVPRDSHGAHGQATLTLHSDNVPDDRKRIEKCGGKILSERDVSWGHLLVFEDLDGNVLKLFNPK
ncbi:MAG: VOC family protein [Oligoflexales bacterium]